MNWSKFGLVYHVFMGLTMNVYWLYKHTKPIQKIAWIMSETSQFDIFWTYILDKSKNALIYQ